MDALLQLANRDLLPAPGGIARPGPVVDAADDGAGNGEHRRRPNAGLPARPGGALPWLAAGDHGPRGAGHWRPCGQGRRRRHRRGMDDTPALTTEPFEVEPTVPLPPAVRTSGIAERVDLAMRHVWAARRQALRPPPPPVLAVRVGDLGVEMLLDAAEPDAPGRFVTSDDGHGWTLSPEVAADDLRRTVGEEPAPLPALVTVDHARGPGPGGPGPYGHVVGRGRAGPGRRVPGRSGAGAGHRSLGGRDSAGPCRGRRPPGRAGRRGEPVEAGGDRRVTRRGRAHDAGGADHRLAGGGVDTGGGRGRPAEHKPRRDDGHRRCPEGAQRTWRPGGTGSHRRRHLATGHRRRRPSSATPSAGARRAVLDAEAVALDGPGAERADGAAPVMRPAPQPNPRSDSAAPWPRRAGGRPAGRWRPAGAVRTRRKLEEVVVYLATHPERPVPAERLRTAIWPLSTDERAGEVADSSFRATMSRTRTALGTDALGRPYLPEARDGCYQLDRALGCDWVDFADLVGRALLGDCSGGHRPARRCAGAGARRALCRCPRRRIRLGVV